MTSLFTRAADIEQARIDITNIIAKYRWSLSEEVTNAYATSTQGLTIRATRQLADAIVERLATPASPVQPARATPSIDQITKTIRDHVYRNAGPMQLFEWSAPDIKEPHAGWRLAPQAAQSLATSLHKAFASIAPDPLVPGASIMEAAYGKHIVHASPASPPQITESEFICLSNLLTFLRKHWDGDTVLVKGSIGGHQNAFPIHHSSYAEALRKAIATAIRTSPVQPEPAPPPAVSFATVSYGVRVAIHAAVTSGIMTKGAREFLRAVQDQLNSLYPSRGPTTFASQAQEPKEEGINLDPNLTAEITRITQAWLTRSTADRIKAIAGLYTVFANSPQEPTQ